MQLRFKIAAVALLLLSHGAMAEDWFQLIQVTSEETAANKMDYTVRFTPARNHHCDKIVFECVYHQKFPWENVRGKKYIKVHEPVNFEYIRRDVKMVHDLDEYISFRTPYGLETLSKVYGPKFFNKDFPVTVDRIIMTGFSGGAEIWTYAVKIGAKLNAAALAKQHAAEEIPAGKAE